MVALHLARFGSMPKRAAGAAKDEAEAGAAKRAAPARNAAYLGFRGLVIAELDEFGPRGLSFKAKVEEVPFYFCMRADVLFFTTFFSISFAGLSRGGCAVQSVVNKVL